jgi:hypothetical protein
MIIFSQSSFKAEGLTFFPDDRDEQAWYYLPDGPSISSSADGMAGIRFVKYRRLPSSEGPMGGGVFGLDVELGPTTEVLARATAALRAAHPGTDLRVQPVRPEGVTCRLRIAPDEGAGPPAAPQSASVDPPHRVVFQTMLSMAATTLFETAMNARAAIGTVEYQLRLTARRPSIPAVLTVNWSRAGDVLTNRTAADEAMSFGQIEDAVRELVASGSIRIELRPSPAGDATAGADEATHEAAMLLAANLFDVGGADSTPAAPRAGGPSTIERAIMNAHGYVRRPAAIGGTATYDLSQPRAAALTVSAADSLAHMMAAVPAAKLPATTLMEERSVSFKIDVRAIEYDWIRMVEVTLTYGDRRVDLVLDRDQPVGSATFVTDEQLGHRVGYQHRSFVNTVPYIEASQPSLEAPPRVSETGVLVIDPREVFNVIPLRAAAMFPYDQYRAAFVDVKVEVPAEGWSTTRTMTLQKDHSEDGFSLVIARASTPTIQYRVRHVAQSGSVSQGDWQPADGLMIVVGLPAAAPA